MIACIVLFANFSDYIRDLNYCLTVVWILSSIALTGTHLVKFLNLHDNENFLNTLLFIVWQIGLLMFMIKMFSLKRLEIYMNPLNDTSQVIKEKLRTLNCIKTLYIIFFVPIVIAIEVVKYSI